MKKKIIRLLEKIKYLFKINLNKENTQEKDIYPMW